MPYESSVKNLNFIRIFFNKDFECEKIDTQADWEENRVIKEEECIQFANEYIKPLVDLLHSLTMQHANAAS